ncbi:MAG: hypothetical protein KF876_07730 [Nitrospira sp.]|nr:hypothetical protein [Nitrospira sp.]MBX3333999.1 hypothetical protein [Nitrospira sp.]MDR4465748.1 hypothetical protein [Nitrospira sp.]MDR4469489.1 hypothetical protein [Nitrospira sp.]
MEQDQEMKNWFDNGDTTGQWGTNTLRTKGNDHWLVLIWRRRQAWYGRGERI